MSLIDEQRKRPKLNPFHHAIRVLFSDVGIVLVTQYSKKKGAWKLGKTDISLYIAQLLLYWRIVHSVATNINTYGYFPQISDLWTLKRWLFDKRTRHKRKLYIFDELNIHAPKRKSMYGKNIEIIQIFPEISKARGRLIGICQDMEGIDKDFRKKIFTRGYLIKKTLKRVHIFSQLLPRNISFNGIPKTSVKFDPYETAPFTERPPAEIMFKEEDMKKAWLWAKGDKRAKEYFSHPMQCNRFVRKVMLQLLEKSITYSHTHTEEDL